MYLYLFLTANLAYTPSQGVYGTASMSEPPQEPSLSAAKAIDGTLIKQFQIAQ